MSSDRIKVLSQFIPINSLSKESISKLASETKLKTYSEGDRIFAIGDNDDEHLFLLKGEIALYAKDGRQSILKAGSVQGQYAIANLKPRLYDAKANSDEVAIAMVNADLLDKLMIWDDTVSDMKNSLSVDEIDSDDESDAKWRMSMLKTQIFLTLPATNIRNLFEQMEEMVVNEGDVIVNQGDIGDYYYIIKEGTCIVSRNAGLGGEDIIINKLGPLQSFGEEALVTGEPRNASVIMSSDGKLERLAKSDFHILMEAPLLNMIDRTEANKLIHEGSIAIDVRMEDEFSNSAIKNTLNIPLYLLRLKMPRMDKNKAYVVFCDTGARSSAAAFLMKKNGFNRVYILKDGLPVLASS